MRNVAILLVVVVGMAGTTWGAEASGGAVLLLPFAAVGETRGAEWIGQAVQQSLLSDLSRVKTLQPLVPGTAMKGAIDLEGARQAGKAAGADYVVYGSYQLGEVGLRITGQVLDVNSGRFVGGVKATGSVRELFEMEDAIAEQTKRILSKQVWAAEAAAKVEPVKAQAVEANDEQRAVDRPWERDEQWIQWARERPYDRDYRGGYWRYTYGNGPAYGYAVGGGYVYPRYSYYPARYHRGGRYGGR
jgi:TolB-like protein